MPRHARGIPATVAEQLGRRLHAEGFRPLPDVDQDGKLIGTHLWRVRDGYVECFSLRTNGFAHAIRAEATFDYQRPAHHGPVIEHRSSHAVNALNWLLNSATTPSPTASPYCRGHATQVDGGSAGSRPAASAQVDHVHPDHAALGNKYIL